jgi:NAD-dependent dihydropyrimidine dehydrogenase PreA subunit
MKGFHYLADATTLDLNEAACIGCGRCDEVCPHQVFQLSERRARIHNREACMECGACQRNCPVGAITVAAGVGCASGMINEWLREHGITRVSSDCCS